MHGLHRVIIVKSTHILRTRAVTLGNRDSSFRCEREAVPHRVQSEVKMQYEDIENEIDVLLNGLVALSRPLFVIDR